MNTLTYTNVNDDLEVYALKVALWRNLQRLFNCQLFGAMAEKSQKKLQHVMKTQQQRSPTPESESDINTNAITAYAITVQQMAPDAFGEEYDWL